MFRARALLAAWLLGQLCAHPIHAQELREVPRARTAPIMSLELQERMSHPEPLRVWVYFTDKATGGSPGGLRAAIDGAAAAFSQRALARIEKLSITLGIEDVPVSEAYVSAVARTGAEIRHRLRWLNAVSAVVAPTTIEAIARLPFVAHLDVVRGRPMTRIDEAPEWLDATEQPTGDRAGSPTAFYGLAFAQYDKLQIDDAHDAGYTGKGVTIAMFDSGFDRSHRVFHNTPLIAEHDFVQNDDITWDQPGMPDAYPDTDCQMGHGTSTWSCVGGYYPGKMVGVAFEAEFALAKTEYTPTETHPEEDNWAAAAEWAFTTVGADIISSSLGYRYDFTSGSSYSWEQLDGKTTIVARAANELAERGILVVNSAGNEGQRGTGSIISPADSDSALAVGAVAIGSEQRTSFSSQGPCAPACPTCPQRVKPDVMAPGEGVYGAIAQGGACGTQSADDPYSRGLSGTSFSCPIAAGSAALVLEAHPSWTPFEIRRAMKLRAKETQAGHNPSTTMGWGVLRVYDAINYESPSPPVLPLPFDLVSPASFTDTGQAIADQTPTFTWTTAAPGQIPLPSVYIVQLASEFEFTHPQSSDAIADTTFTVPVTLAEGFYYWRVTAAPSGTPGLSRESRARSRILIDHPPTVASLVFPAANDSLTETLRPTFVWRRAEDASPTDTITYRLRIAVTSDFGIGTRTFEGLADTTFTLPASAGLDERHFYWCKVDATDRFGATTTSDVVLFQTGAFPPLPFALATPAEGDTVSIRRPTLTWSAAEDPFANDTITYEVYVGATRTSLVRARQGVASTSWEVDQGRLQDDTSYFWSAVAVDMFGARTPSPDTLEFVVRTAPLPFLLDDPVNDAVVYTTHPTFRWDAAPHDLPGETMTYTLRVFADESRSTLVTSVAGVAGLSVRPADALAAGTYYWDVVAKDSRGRETASGEVFTLVVTPAPLVLAARLAPNPFAPRASDLAVTYDVPEDASGRALTIDVHDVMGRVVRRLVHGVAVPGAEYVATWDGRGENGVRLPAGVYYVEIGVSGKTETQRVVLLGR